MPQYGMIYSVYHIYIYSSSFLATAAICSCGIVHIVPQEFQWPQQLGSTSWHPAIGNPNLSCTGSSCSRCCPFWDPRSGDTLRFSGRFFTSPPILGFFQILGALNWQISNYTYSIIFIYYNHICIISLMFIDSYCIKSSSFRQSECFEML